MLKLLVIFGVLTLTFEFGAGANVDLGINCPLSSIGVKILDTCNVDCKTQHGGTSGKCDTKTSRCFCQGLSAKAGAKSPAVQCQKSSGDLKTGYDTLCLVDCQCNHGAGNGTCDYPNRRCRCGANVTQSSCLHSWADFQKLFTTYKLPSKLTSKFKF